MSCRLTFTQTKLKRYLLLFFQEFETMNLKSSSPLKIIRKIERTVCKSIHFVLWYLPLPNLRNKRETIRFQPIANSIIGYFFLSNA